MNIFENSLGLFTESDYVSLSVGLKIDGHYLLDTANNARHLVSKETKLALYFLSEPIVITEWIGTTLLSDAQMLEILVFLDSIGGVNIDRSIRMQIKSTFIKTKYYLSSIKFQTNSKRLPASIIGLNMAILLSFKLLISIFIFTGVLVYGANMSITEYIKASSTFILTLYLSTLAHEYIHIYIAKKFQKPVILLRGMRFGVLHDENKSPNLKLYSSLLGPLAGIFMSLILLGFFKAINSSTFTLASILAVLFVHLMSYLPFYGDGETILRYIKRKNYATTT